MGSTKTRAEMLQMRVRMTCFLFSLQIPSWISCLPRSSKNHSTIKIGQPYPGPCPFPSESVSFTMVNKRHEVFSIDSRQRAENGIYRQKQKLLPVSTFSSCHQWQLVPCPHQNKKQPLRFYFFASDMRKSQFLPLSKIVTLSL